MRGLERIVLDQPFFAGLGPEFGAAISGCAIQFSSLWHQPHHGAPKCRNP